MRPNTSILNVSTSMGNFINLPYSLAIRHQCYQCYMLTIDDQVLNNILPTSTAMQVICVYILLYTGSEIPVSLSRFEHQLGGMGYCDKLYRLVIPANSIVKMQIKYCSIHCRTSWVKVNGVCYKKGVVVITLLKQQITLDLHRLTRF